MATFSTKDSVSDLLSCDLLTSVTIFEITESFAFLVTTTSKYPSSLTVPENTSSPISFSTGTLSPVIEAWLTDDEPEITLPSKGTLSPGFTITISPIFTSSTFLISSDSPTFTLAVSGAISTNDLIERLALCSA